MRKIKICYVICTLSYGGAEIRLAEVLNKLDRSKFEPYLICLESGPLEKTIKNDVRIFNLHRHDKYFCLLKKTINYIQTIKIMKKIMQKHKFDIVQCFIFESTFLGTIAARLAKIPIVIATRGQCALTDNKLAIFLRSFINPLADLIMSDSLAIQNSMLKWEFTPTKTKVVYNGKDPEMFDISVDKEKKRKELRIPKNNKVITMVANLHWYKGYQHLLRAAKLVINQKPNTVFLIVGDGIERKSLESLAKKLEISKNICFLGHRGDVFEILRITDISVLTSYSEGFSNTVLEAMGMALPQVITNVGGNKEAVIDGKTGFLTPPREHSILVDRILYLLENPVIAKHMGEAGKQRLIENFTSKKMLKEMENIYFKLLCQKKSKSST